MEVRALVTDFESVCHKSAFAVLSDWFQVLVRTFTPFPECRSQIEGRALKVAGTPILYPMDFNFNYFPRNVNSKNRLLAVELLTAAPQRRRVDEKMGACRDFYEQPSVPMSFWFVSRESRS
jgi:hypothetical protein